MGLTTTTTPAPTGTQLARRKAARARRTRVLADGGRRLELLLDQDATQALERLMASGETATEVVAGLLLRAASKTRRR